MVVSKFNFVLTYYICFSILRVKQCIYDEKYVLIYYIDLTITLKKIYSR